MAATQTLAELRTRAKRRADMEGAGSSGFITDAEWTEYVNNGCQRFYNLLLKARGHEYYIAENDNTMVVGTATYALPSDHMLTLSMLASSDGVRNWHEVHAWQEEDYARLLGGNQASAGSVYARIRGGNIHVLPAPSDAFTLRHVYVPTFTRLSSDSDTFDGINGWEEAVVLYAAIAALKKEESFEHAAALTGELKEYEQAIEEMAAHRHMTQPNRVRNTRMDDVDGDWFPAHRQRWRP